MRRWLGPSIRRIYEQATFMANRRLLTYSIAVIAANAFTMIYMVMVGGLPSTATWLSTPLILSIIIYKLLITLQVAGIGREVSAGEVQLYLAHTLTRAEYLLSALLVTGFTPALLLIATYSTTIAIVAPGMLQGYLIREFIPYIFLDILFLSIFTILIAVRGHEFTASAIGLFTAVGVWIATAILLSIYVYSGYSLAGKPILYIVYLALCICAVVSPFTYYTLYTVYPMQSPPYIPPAPIPLPAPLAAGLSSLLLTVALLTVALRGFKSRDI